MAAPTLQGSSAIGAQTAATSFTLTLPTHQADDILLVCCGIRAPGASLNVSGWTFFEQRSTSNGEFFWFWKRATSGAESNPVVSVTAGSADHYGQAHVIRGCILTGNPWDVKATSDATTGADPDTFTGVTTTVADTLIFVCGVELDNVVTSVVLTATDPASIGTASSTSNRYVVSATGADGGCWGIGAAKASIGATGSVSANWSAVPDGGAALVIAFKPPAGATAYAIDAAPGSYALTGVAAGPVAGRMLNAAPGSYALTGFLAALARGYQINAQPGSYAITGSSASTVADRLLNAAPGAYAVTGQSAAAVAGRVLSADPGSYALTGAVADLVYTAGAVGYVLNAEPGSYALSGADAGTLADRVIQMSPGVYNITGLAAAILAGRVISADPGAYSLTGAQAGVVAGRAVSALPGVYALAGAPAGTLAARVIVASPGSYALTGVAATLVFDAGEVVVVLRLRRFMGLGS